MSALRSGLLLLCLLTASGGSHAQSNSQGVALGAAPSQIEQDFWRSADRIGTVESYKAYLDAFPAGAFVALARAATKKIDSAPIAADKESPAHLADRPAANSKDALRPFSASRESDSFDVKPGDRLNGPGVLTVGRAGSKKQLVIPRGEWIVLATVDHRSTHAQPVPMSSISLARFVGNRMESMLVASVNSRPGLSGNVWSDAAQCEIDTGKAIFREVQGPFSLRRCVLVTRVDPSTSQRPVGPISIWPGTLKALEGLGAAMEEFNVATTVILVNARASYLRVVRLDCVGRRPDLAGCPSLLVFERGPLPGALTPKVESAVTYMRASAEGFGRDIDGEDLEPSANALRSSLFLLD